MPGLLIRKGNDCIAMKQMIISYISRDSGLKTNEYKRLNVCLNQLISKTIFCNIYASNLSIFKSVYYFVFVFTFTVFRLGIDLKSVSLTSECRELSWLKCVLVMGYGLKFKDNRIKSVIITER